jgi:hypothetical protein
VQISKNCRIVPHSIANVGSLLFVCSMVQLPESNFEKMTAEAREKERLDSRKMLVSLPKSKVKQEYLSSVAARVVDLREDIEDLVLVANEETDAALKVKLLAGDQVCGLTVSAVKVTQPSLEVLLLASSPLVPWSSGIQVDEVKNCNKGEITAIRIFTVSQKGSHSVQKLKLVFIYLILHLSLHNTRK